MKPIRMKNFNLKRPLMLLGLALSMNACEDFEPEFPVVEIINQPPKITEIATQTVVAGFGTFEVNLNSFIIDQENDKISYVITNSDPSVVTVIEKEGVLTFTEVGEGITTINILATDAPGNSVETSFDVIVEQAEDRAFFIFADFEVPDGAADTYTVENGSWETWGFPGASIVDGTFLWDIDPDSSDNFRYWALGFTSSAPLDLSNNSYFAFDYKNLTSASNIGFYIASSTDGEVEFTLADLGVEVIEGNPNFNTFEIENLGAKILEIAPSFDLANIVEFGFNTDGALPVSFDNIRIKEISPYTVFADFEVPDGAADTYSVNFGSWETWGFPGAQILDGTFLWDVDPANPDETFRYWAVGFTPSNPLDLSDDSYFAFDYKNLASASTIGFYIASSTDGEVEFTLADLGVEVIEGNPNFNTFEIENLGAKILEINPSFDLANIVEFGFNTEGGLPVSFDNIKIGKN